MFCYGTFIDGKTKAEKSRLDEPNLPIFKMAATNHGIFCNALYPNIHVCFNIAVFWTK